jgi:hypothetical protein
MSEIRVNSLGNESNTGGPVLSGITTFSGQQYFIPPTGTTAQRPSGCPPGSIRFNTDSAHLEYWNGLVWLEFEASSVELGDQNAAAGSSASGTGARGLFSRGYVAPANVNTIDYITISTQGNTQDFGDTFVNKRQGVSFSSRTRSLTAGAEDRNNTIDFVTISSTGDAQDFGDLAKGRSENPGAVSNQTRAIVAGGNEATPGRTNAMEAITMATLGNGVDFGDLIIARQTGVAGANSSVRGVFAGGDTPGNSNVIDYMTISTLGNALDFGDLTAARNHAVSADSATRGVFAGGYVPSATNIIDFITIATIGNAQDFGDLTTARVIGNGGTSNCIRGVFGFYASPQAVTEFCQIATTGNAQSFGDLGSGARQQASASSNGHGGL